MVTRTIQAPVIVLTPAIERASRPRESATVAVATSVMPIPTPKPIALAVEWANANVLRTTKPARTTIAYSR
jgi:hypothetical protein